MVEVSSFFWSAIERLRQNRFPERAIAEASFNPYGIIGLTLHYGRRKAQAIVEDKAFAVYRKRVYALRTDLARWLAQRILTNAKTD